MLLPPDGICLTFENDSHLAFVELASTSTSEDKVNVPVPDEEPKKCRTVGALVVDDGERL